MEGLEILRDILSTANPQSLVIVFTFGTLFGSFINVCIWRLPVGKSIVWPGSACTSCGVPLQWWQNLPVISYLALGGRCQYCRTPFSIRYLLMELLSGGVAALLLTRLHGLGFAFFYDYLFSALLIIVFFVDLDAWIILDEVNFFGIAAGVLGATALPMQYGVLEDFGVSVAGVPRLVGNVGWSLLGAALGYAFFLGIALVGSMLARQEAMGRGDVKFAALIGAFLGPQRGLLALFGSFPLGALFAVPLILLRRKSGKTPVPFGTFMAVAAFAMAAWGDPIMGWLADVGNPFRSPLW